MKKCEKKQVKNVLHDGDYTLHIYIVKPLTMNKVLLVILY